MLNKSFLEHQRLLQWKHEFDKAKPFRYVIIDDFLETSFADRLAREFPSLEEMNINYKGVNEKKSEHSDFGKLPAVFSELKKVLSLDEITTAIETICGIPNLRLIDDRLGYGLHQGGKGSFLDIHVDYNLHPVQRVQRRLNMIVFLNHEWQKSWGGLLEFWNREVTKCEKSILPLFNRCVLFECHEYSFHGYSKITCPQEITRKSFYQYYFSEATSKIVFHDTIFKSKPEESIFKKIRVSLKETTKNVVKRTFFDLKLKRLLK